jgi:hypothetical protein
VRSDQNAAVFRKPFAMTTRHFGFHDLHRPWSRPNEVSCLNCGTVWTTRDIEAARYNPLKSACILVEPRK